MPAPNALPIGTITAFGGDLANNTQLKSIIKAGWLVCDGSSYQQNAYPELFKAIGAAHGGDAISFNVPDLRDRFLRGTAGASIVDPDSGNRGASAAGGATGNQTGSLQPAATGLPKNEWALQAVGPHTHSRERLSPKAHKAWKGSQYEMARRNAAALTKNAGAHFHRLTGFEPVTEPVCMALYFIIKASEPRQFSGTIPAGVIIGFGGRMFAPPGKWLGCDGTAYDSAQYPNLMNAIGNNYGGDGRSALNVPDLRGYFLRGASHDTGRDPDTLTRHALNKGGNAGGKVGSAQFYATASPKALAVTADGAHYHRIAKVPYDCHHAAYAYGPAADDCMLWTDDEITSSESGGHNHTITGGDNETRPENVYADFLVASDNLPESAPPVGTIMAFGGDITNDRVLNELKRAGWLVCDGDILSTMFYAYKELEEVIGDIYGFRFYALKLPDLRGYFIKGAGKVRVGTLHEVSTTGASINPVITSTDGDHTHTIDNVPTEAHTISVAAGVNLANYNPGDSHTSIAGEHSHRVSGGDAESRPVNVSVNYIIRCEWS